MKLVVPALEYLEAYADALRRGFWSDNLRREESAREELAMIAADPADFVASLDDPEGKRPPIRLPDGTTIAYVPSATIVQKLTMASVPFDPMTDIAPITLAGTVQTAFCVSPTIGVSTLPEYIAWLKQNPTRHSFGTTALGSFTHFFGVMAGREFGIPLEPVPYRGAAPLVADLQGGHIAAGCGGITDFLEHHRAGKVKVIFTSGIKPTTSAPEIPTATQLGYPKLNILGWYVFFAPAKTPPALIDAWGKELKAVLMLPEVNKKLVELGLDVETSTPAEFSQRMATDLARWKTIIDQIGYKPGN